MSATASIVLLSLSALFFALAAGFLFRPRRMVGAHTRFRKRMERFEKRLFKAHRAMGLGLAAVGSLILLAQMHPEWIFKMIFLARVIAWLIAPDTTTNTVLVKATSTVWI